MILKFFGSSSSPMGEDTVVKCGCNCEGHSDDYDRGYKDGVKTVDPLT